MAAAAAAAAAVVDIPTVFVVADGDEVKWLLPVMLILDGLIMLIDPPTEEETPPTDELP